jgi:hypothetical protein
LKDRQWLGANRKDLCPAASKETVSLTQARQLRATIGSHETA